MSNFVITTDSNSDIPAKYMEQFDITVIPQYYAFGEDVYGDEKNLTPSEFYQKMRDGALPTSMANNPAVIRSKFKLLLDKGLDILHIAFSSALSGSYSNVVVTARELMDEYPGSAIEVIDSLNVSLGETLMVLQAYDLKSKGKSMIEIKDILENEVQNANVWFTVNDLHHLQRGGRVSKATAIIGSMISIKPLLCVSPEGKLVSSSTVRGRKKSITALIDKMASSLEENYDKSQTLGIVHGDCLEEAQYLSAQIQERLGFTNIIVADLNPSIGSHAGPGTIGLFYKGRQRQ